MEQIFYWIGGILISIIGYFLKATMEELKSVKELAMITKNKVDLVENDHKHLTDKFEQLNESMKNLTDEIKHLTRELSKKKDV